MTLFSYIAVDKSGKKVTGVYRAENEEEVLAFLYSKDLVPISVSLFSSAKKKKKHKKWHNNVTLEDYLFFARQMSVMLDAGVPLLRVIDVILGEITSKKFAQCLKDVREHVAGGWSLEKAIARHPDVFNNLWVNIIKTGEATGRLGFVLGRLADHLEMQASFRKKIISSLIYPALLLVMTIAAVLFLSIFIIPKFKDLFEGFGQKLPALTQFVLSVSDFLQHNFISIIVAVVFIGIGLRLFLASPIGKSIWDRVILEIPFLRDFVKTSLMENVAANLAILSQSGVPILVSLDIVAESMGNSLVSFYVHLMKERVREGLPLAVAMEETGFFDSIVIQMISVGEEVGELSEMLDKVAKYYRENMENMLLRFTSLFEPLMLVVMAGVIGVLVAAIFMPIFQMANMGEGNM